MVLIARASVACRESALLAFNGEHLLPAERPYAWLGSLRPSEAAAGLLAKLGDDISAAATGRLHSLQVGCMGAQGLMA